MMDVRRTLLPLMVLAVAACSRGDAARGPALDAQRVVLSEGYSMLYADASSLDLIHLILYVKLESQEFEDVITEISGFAGELKHDLERIARDYPGVQIDLVALPEMEKRKRRAVGKERALRFAPFSGHSRQEYERTVLIGMANALNHEGHLCGVMAEEEPDPGLKKFLLATQRRYRLLHERATGLLEREHFRAPAK